MSFGFGQQSFSADYGFGANRVQPQQSQSSYNPGTGFGAGRVAEVSDYTPSYRDTTPWGVMRGAEKRASDADKMAGLSKSFGKMGIGGKRKSKRRRQRKLKSRKN
jgi:hypothetical protein